MSVVNAICRELTHVWNTVSKMSGHDLLKTFMGEKQEVYT
jgi:hypothetical protein